MKIARVSLANFRCHARFEADFTDGINLLLGRNGSGKTSVFEAIGIILFDRSRTGKTYSDAVGPAANYADIEAEFVDSTGMRWKAKRRIGKQPRSLALSCLVDGAWQEAPPAQLPALFGFAGPAAEDVFRTVIVAEQNAFVAPFLERPADRERIFNRVFGISRWRELADMAALENPYSAELTGIEGRHKDLQEDARRYDMDSLQEKSAQLEQEGETRRERLQALKTERDALDRYLAALRAQEAAKAKDENSAELLEEAGRQITMLDNAAAWLAGHADQIREHEKLSGEKDILHIAARMAAELEGKRQALANAEEQARRLESDILNDQAAEGRLAQEVLAASPQLEKSALEIPKLENSLVSLGEAEKARREACALRDAQQAAQRDPGALQAEARQWEAAVTKLGELRAKREAALRLREERVTRKRALSEQRVSLERGHCPLLGEPCGNLAARQDAGSAFVDAELARLDSAIRETAADLNALDSELRSLEGSEERLGAARLAIAESARNAEILRGREARASEAEQAFERERARFCAALCAARGIKIELRAYDEARAAMEELRSEYNALGARQRANQETLASLRSRIARDAGRLDICVREQANLRRQIAQDESALGAALPAGTQPEPGIIRERLSLLDAGLAGLAGIADEAQRSKARLADSREVRDRHAGAAERRNASARELSDACRRSEQALLALKIISPQGDPAEAERQLRAQIEGAQNAIAKAENDRAAIANTIEEAGHCREQIRENEQEMIEARRRLGLVQALRDLLRDMGPWITKRALPRVSGIATRNFRAITGRGERVFWSNEDRESYAVYLAEGAGNGSKRQMAQLSGGEQVALALALRAALVEAITAARFVIFDEPTVNLDQDARRGLADAFGSIFGKIEQAFVITHDDSFEAIANNEIRFS